MKTAWLGSIAAHVLLAGGLFWVAMDRPPVVEIGVVNAVTVSLVDEPAETPAASTPAPPAPAVASPRMKLVQPAARHDPPPIQPARAAAMVGDAPSEPADPLSMPAAIPVPTASERGNAIDTVTAAPMAAATAGSTDHSPAGGAVAAAADPWPAYYAAVRDAVERVKRYPFSARLAGLEDRVAVNFFIAANGAAEQIRLTEPSRFPVLNDAALDIIRRVARFPAPPLRDSQSGVRVTVPLEFTLHTHKETPPE